MTTLHQSSNKLLEALAADHLKRSLNPKSAKPNVIDFSSNDYLGLSQHPAIVEAGIHAAQRYGAGSTGSRLLSGNLACFETLETQLAAFKHMQAALVFSSGYQANASALATLLDKTLWNAEPLVFTDRLNHASLHHACQLAGTKQIRFQHNNLQHLAECLAHYSHTDRPKIIVTETVFGMDGDQLDVPSLANLALEHQALVYLDEAHATGVWGTEGRGLGCSTHPSVEALKSIGHWVVMGTFSKAFGVSGAYVSCSNTVKSLLINRCGGFIYSTAPSPFVIGAVSKALELIPTLNEQRETLHQRAQNLRNALSDKQLNTGSSSTHIVPIVVGSSCAALSLRDFLMEKGIVTSAVRPPTVAPNTARIRLALNTQHSENDLDQLLETLNQWQNPRRNVV